MKKIIVSILVIGLLLSTANLAIAEMEPESDIVEMDFMAYLNEYEYEFVPGELLVKFIEEATVTISESQEGVIMTGIESVDELNMEYGVTSAEKLLEDDSISSLAEVYKFVFDDNVDMLFAMENYSNDPSIELVEPNYIYDFCGIPNDPYFSEQWGLHNTGQTGGTPDADIDAPEAWDAETGDEDVIITILDTGVNISHPDLVDNLLPSMIIFDWCGHGTFCAGIAAAVTDNGIGVAGVAGDCKIMPRLAMGPLGLLTLFYIMRGLINATNNGADVISMSFGGHDSELHRRAIDYANLMGVVLIASAGNGDSRLKLYPAGFDNVIAVAATDQNDNRAFFSTYGSWVDVAAPGVDILSTWKDGYAIASGTSAACPYVSGIAALVKSQNPLLTTREVRTILRSSTEKGDFDHYIGTGRINAQMALQKAAHVVTELDSSLDDKDVEGVIGIKGTAKGILFQEYVVEYGKGIYPEEDDWVEIYRSSTRVYGGVLATLDTTILDEGIHTIRLTVTAGGFTYEDMALVRVDNIAETYYVDDDFTPFTPGWGTTHFDKIMDAIDQYGDKDTISVSSGTYYEHLSIGEDRSVDLVGEDKETTVIDSTNIGYNTISISYGSVSISGFTLKSQTSAYSIDAYVASNCEISGNKFISGRGIVIGGLLEISSDNVISGNTFTDGLIEIPMFGRRNTISNNAVKGIFLGLRSNNNDIYDNTISNNGIELCAASFNNIYDNVISNSEYGIILESGVISSCVVNLISNNTITNNDYGIYLIDIGFGKIMFNVISGNEISNNQEYGIYIASPVANYSEIFHNNFLNNGQHAYDRGNNIWYKPLKLEGNYWDDYEEKYPDANPKLLRPWIWNTPYDIPGGDNQDKYPLVNPYDDGVVKDDYYTTNEAVELNIAAPGVLGNDVDINVDSVTTVLETTVSHGTLTRYADGSFEYTPDLGFFGTDSFTYRVYDGTGYSTMAIVYIEVLEFNRIDLQDGWNLISIPVGEPIDKTSIIVRYDNCNYTWDEAVGGHIVVGYIYGWENNMYTLEDILEPGEGYWMYAYYDCELLLPSNVQADDNITILQPGWNFMGIPYDTALDKYAIRIYYEGQKYTLNEAVTDGVIIDFVYGWDEANQRYMLADAFVPGYGYWMYAYHGCTLKKA